MRAVRLLERAIEETPEKVLDVGVGKGRHAFSFIANGSMVAGLDVNLPPLDDPRYEHIHGSLELWEPAGREFDMIWCSHTLEHLPNVQAALIKLRSVLKDGGTLAIAVPTDRQNRLHVGHLSLWTPAHLVYNLVCAGWDCSEAIWYTEYCTIGLIVKKTDDINYEGRTGMPSEVTWLNQYTPVPVRHMDGAWWENNWPEETEPRIPDPPCVTAGYVKTNLEPESQLFAGPNPKLREGYGREN